MTSTNTSPLTIVVTKNISDLKELLLVYEEVFEWKDFQMPEEDYLTKIIQDEHCIILTAKWDHQVIGGLTAYVLHGYHPPKPLLYIYDFGITTAFQNQGIGTKMMDFLKTYASTNGIKEIFVSTEQTDNDQALAFYRNSGASEEIRTVNFNYFLE